MIKSARLLGDFSVQGGY